MFGLLRVVLRDNVGGVIDGDWIGSNGAVIVVRNIERNLYRHGVAWIEPLPQLGQFAGNDPNQHTSPDPLQQREGVPEQ